MTYENPNAVRSLVFLACFMGAFAIACLAFEAGIYHSRQQIRDLAEDVASHNNNSFTKCLTESWEQSGELNGWKGARKWVLQ